MGAARGARRWVYVGLGSAGLLIACVALVEVRARSLPLVHYGRAPARCDGVPTPGEPKFNPPPFFFPYSTSSAIVLTGLSAGTATIPVKLKSTETGCAPLTGS